MFTISVTNYNTGEGINVTEYTDVNQYKITEDYLILESRATGSIIYIQKAQVLEFEVNWQVSK